jgi:hypothetical protein
VRISLDPLNHDGLTCRLQNAAPKIWRGTDLYIEVGMYFDAVFVDTVTGITSLHLDILPGNDRDGTPLVQKSDASLDTISEGVNLIDGGRDTLEVRIPAAGAPRHAINHITLVAGERGLSLKSPADLFASTDEIDAARHTLLAARQRLERATDTFLNQASMLAPHLGVLEPG